MIDSNLPCLTNYLNPETKKKLKIYYKYTKKYGIRAAFAGVTGTGVFGLIKEATKDGIKRHGKRYLGAILINSGGSLISGGLPLLTNSSKIVRYGKSCHSVCAGAWRVCHSSAELPFVLFDFALFGELVPSCEEDSYDLFSSNSDIISQFTDD